MARARLNPLNSKEIEFEHDKNETLHDLFERFFTSLPTNNEELRDYYTILVDHKEVDKELWKDTVIGDSDILVAVVLKGGSNRGIFKQILVLVAVIVVTIVSHGTAWAVIAPLMTSVGMTLLTNALFPPIDMGGLGSFGTNGYDAEGSQTYTISNQSNKTNKYGTVPKPYGVNKMFPNIAANPYTEITTDPITGEIIQNFFCIYSFGYGPMTISGLKIGDTDFETYNNAHYRLVDLNKPDVSGGSWDDPLNKTFEFYKGDNENTSVTVVIDENQETAGPETPIVEYQVERNASDKGDGDGQEITLVFGCPGGLTTFGTNGGRATRNIELLIEFAEVGTEDWKLFNDTAFAAIGETTGIISDTDNSIHVLFDNMSIISESNDGQYRYENWGIPKGATTFDASDFISNGVYILHGGVNIGKVVSSTIITGGWRYTLASPLETDYIMRVYKIQVYWDCGDDYVESTCVWRDRISTDKWSGILTPWKQQEGTGGTFIISAEKTTAVYSSVTIKPFTTNQVKVRVTRVRSYGGYSYRVVDGLTWSTMNARFDRQPIVTPQRHLFLEVKIQATDQLNGTIQNLSAITSSVLNVYDDNTSTWNLEETQNPAWVFADLLTGAVNRRALDLDRLDTDSLVEWAEYSDIHSADDTKVFEMPRYQSNFILDFKVTLNNILMKVSNAAGASLNLVNGKYGVLIDREKTVPVQMFTPRNSSDFSSTRKYVKLPHALKIRYVDGRSNWSVREEVVYADGYSVLNAETFEDMDTFGCTNNEQAWRYGKYLLAQAILRQETISITVDFENLVCTRGDYVLLQHDAMKVGGVPARVKTVVGNTITIDDSFVDGGGSYGYTFRGTTGISTGTLTILDVDSAELTGTLPSVGDLIIWGEIDSITMNMIVKAISPQSDMKAVLTLVERANEIHDAESSTTQPVYSPQLTTQVDEFTPPGEVENLEVSENTWECFGGGYQYYLTINWGNPSNSAVEIYEVYVNSGGGFVLAGYTSATTFKYIVDPISLGTEHSVKVLAVAATGNKITLGQVTAVTSTPESKVLPPSDVEGAYINITNEALQFDWDLVSDCDIDHYLIRYSASTTATWLSSIPLQRVDRATSSVVVQGRTGSYFVKAVDWNGNESTVAASAVTAIPNLFDLNIIEETNDFPALTGAKDRVETFSGNLILQEETSGGMGVVEYFSEGYYYYNTLLDLGEIYTVRLQSLIEAEGYSSDDLMVNWETLDSIDSLTSASTSDWSVEAQYRSTEELITMSSWTTLDSVPALDSGIEEVWSPWRRLLIGDFTGRVFQFRLKLISNKASITPRVFDGIIRADMPDRIESYDNLTATTLGYNMVYTPAFKGPGTTPAIQITQDDASTGDYYKITSKSLDGFTIKFYDNTDTLVERQFDVMVKGYGRKATSVL